MKIKTGFEDIFLEYTKGNAFKSNIGLFENVKQNENYYVGKQWEGVQAPDLDKPVMNIIRRVVTFFLSTIVSDDIAVGVKEFNENPASKQVLDMISGKFAEVMELASVKTKLRQVIRDAAVDGDGCMHYFFDVENCESVQEETKSMLTLKGTPGQIEAEVLDNTNVIFGNPYSAEVQKQPYILVSYRRLVAEVKEKAKSKGQSTENINSDAALYSNEKNDDGNMITLVRKYWKENGVIFYTEVTAKALITPKTKTGLRRYPIAWMPWIKVKNQYHGHSPISEILPNQRYINKIYALMMRHVETMAFPTVVYNKMQMPGGWDNAVGSSIGVNGDPNGAVASNFKPADMSGQTFAMADIMMTSTRDTMGASDAALGNVKPDNTSAIIATQKYTSMPLELQKMDFYQFVEDSVRIWLDMMSEYYGVRQVSIAMPKADENGNTTQRVAFNFASIKQMNLRLNIDVGTATYWSELVQVQTLDNLFTRNIIPDAETYLDLIPAAYIPNKQEIKQSIQRKKAQEESLIT